MPEVVTGTAMGVVKHVGAAIACVDATVIDAATTKAARPALPAWQENAFNLMWFMIIPAVDGLEGIRVGQLKLENAARMHLTWRGTKDPANCQGRQSACLLANWRSMGRFGAAATELAAPGLDSACLQGGQGNPRLPDCAAEMRFTASNRE